MTMEAEFPRGGSLPPDEAHERHDEVFPVRIYRRIRNLREKLLEVIIEQLRLERRTASAASFPMDPTGLLAVFRHREDDHSDVFEVYPKSLCFTSVRQFQDVFSQGDFFRRRRGRGG